MKNPLLTGFDTPFNTAPFSKIENAHYLPAIEESIKIAKEEINAITSNKEEANFENTIEAFENAGELLNRAATIFFNINSAETSEEIQKIAQEISPLISEYSNDVFLNEDLFKRIKQVWDKRDDLNLDKVQLRLLEINYKNFVRNGIMLDDESKKKLRNIDKELSTTSLKYGENVLAETNSFEMLLEEKDLDGLPESLKEAAALSAKSKNKEGYLFTLHFPSYMPFMKYSSRRDLREKMAVAYGSRAFRQNEFNNSENVLKIARLREERAKLLGFKTHAQFILEQRMAETPENVESFLNELLSKAKPAAEKEFKELEDFAKKLDNIDRLESWDSAYYTEKLKQEKFDFDSEKLKEYFELDKVIDGVFKVAGKLYGLTFKEVFNIEKYHEEVKTYEVYDENSELISIFYADFHPRDGKQGGAWMTSYKEQRLKNGKDERPHISIVCNFTKATETRPSLLSFMEVTTLFHEFGHALHGMLSKVKYQSLAGTNVYWDFVELPSQVLENWCYEKEALDLFAKHYKTGESIPQEMVDKIKASSNFMEGLQTLRQLNFGLLDMKWHNNSNTAEIKDISEFEIENTNETNLYPVVEGTSISNVFSHIFQGGYSAGYYSYKWAEVLDADAFKYFKEKGIFSKELADSFKENILSKGGSEHPAELYRKFRGRDAKVDALLERAGLL